MESYPLTAPKSQRCGLGEGPRGALAGSGEGITTWSPAEVTCELPQLGTRRPDACINPIEATGGARERYAPARKVRSESSKANPL